MGSKTPAAAAVMFCVEGKFYVRAVPGVPPKVHAFETLSDAVRHFEGGYMRAHGQGGGFSAGAIVFFLQLRPRVFVFKSIERLRKLLGKTILARQLTGNGINETVFEAQNERFARSLYKSAVEPRLANV